MEENEIEPEKQRCFLCFNIILVASGFQSNQNNLIESDNKLFLRQLCHHLNISCVQQLTVSGDSANSTRIIFCYKCQQLCFEFNRVFKFYELAQLRLQNVVERISNEMNREFGEDLEPVDPTVTTAMLRKVIIEKTQAKLSKLRSPLVLIHRLTEDEISLLTSTSTSMMAPAQKTEVVHDHEHVDAEFKIANLQSANLGVVVKTEVDVDLEVLHQNLEQVDLLEETDVFKWEAKVKKEEIHDNEEEDAASTSRSRPRKKKMGRHREAPEPNTFKFTSGGRFKCCHCSKSYGTKMGWKFHFESIHQKIRHKCPKCSTTFSVISTLNIHLKTCDGRRRPPPMTYPKNSFIKLKNGQVQCNLDLDLGDQRHNQCQKPYSDKGSWKVHYLNIHQKLRFICEKCGSSFTQESTMKTHKTRRCNGRRRTPSPSELSEGRTFSRHGVIGVYTKYFRLTQDGKFACKFCKKEYVNQSGFYAHYRAVHRNVRWKCEKCLETFTQNCTLTNHRKVCPGAPKVSKPKEHFCKFCGKGFTSSHGKTAHEQKHEGVRFQCDKCEKFFAYKNCLSRHVCAKSGDLQIQAEGRVGSGGFKCKHCHQLFPTYIKRRNHYTAQKLRKYSYRCQKCHSIITYQCGLAPHQKKCDGAEFTKIEENGPRFSCDICKKVFTSQGALKGHHEGIHQGMTFKCELCGKEFANQNNVRRHMLDSCPKSETKPRPKQRHKCSKCPKDFCSAQALGFHFDRVHLKRRVKCDQCGALVADKKYLSQHKRKFCPVSKSNTAGSKAEKLEDSDTDESSLS